MCFQNTHTPRISFTGKFSVKLIMHKTQTQACTRARTRKHVQTHVYTCTHACTHSNTHANKIIHSQEHMAICHQVDIDAASLSH